MYNVNFKTMKTIAKNVLIICALFMISFLSAQSNNGQIELKRISDTQFGVKSINGIPFTVILEKSKRKGQYLSDGQYLLDSHRQLVFDLEDITEETTLRIVLEKQMYLTVQNNLVDQYTKDVQWIESKLSISEDKSKIFPTRPVMSDADAKKLKDKVVSYVDSQSTYDLYNQWEAKFDYSVASMRFFQQLYDASNGTKNESRSVFLPIKILEALGE